MKVLFIIYHEDLEPQVRNVLHRGMVVPRYTRIDDVIGARMVEAEEETGIATERHNRMVTVIADENIIGELVSDLERVRRAEGHGLRGFVVDATQVF